MAYLDMKALSTDATYIQRVNYALETFINKVNGEASTTTNHTQRLSFVTKAMADIPGTVTNFLIPRLGQDPVIINLVNALPTKTVPDTIDDNIPDATLQTEVESISTTFATQPIDYTSYFNTANDGSFRNRIQSAVIQFVNTIMTEPATTPSHTSRFSWAKQAVVNIQAIVQIIALPVVLDPKVAPVLYAVTDADLLTAVENQISTYLL